MELVGALDRPGRGQQIEGRLLRAPRGLDNGLRLGRVLVGLEEDLVELLAHRRRAVAGDDLARPRIDLQRLLTLALDAEQRGLDDVLRRLPEVAAAEAAEVVRRAEEGEQHRGLLLDRGLLR